MSDWSESPNVTEETYNTVQWGKKLERERIIALLEETYATSDDNPEYFWADILTEPRFRELIALIKGEQK
jgi:hypothetical protein